MWLDVCLRATVTGISKSNIRGLPERGSNAVIGGIPIWELRVFPAEASHSGTSGRLHGKISGLSAKCKMLAAAEHSHLSRAAANYAWMHSDPQISATQVCWQDSLTPGHAQGFTAFESGV
jgi:hypothetical protein